MGGQHGICRGCGGMVVNAFCIACKKPPKTYNDIATSIDLRDQIAMAALTGLLSNPIIAQALAKLSENNIPSKFACDTAYEFADGMMKRRDE